MQTIIPVTWQNWQQQHRDPESPPLIYCLSFVIFKLMLMFDHRQSLTPYIKQIGGLMSPEFVAEERKECFVIINQSFWLILITDQL